jgi:hypothetical protein
VGLLHSQLKILDGRIDCEESVMRSVRPVLRLGPLTGITRYQNQDRQKENVKNNNQQYRQNARDYVFEYLSTHPCSICGETDPVVLEFHHVGDKDNEVSRLMGRGASLEALIREIKKCSVVCANCHRRITAEERGWYKKR